MSRRPVGLPSLLVALAAGSGVAQEAGPSLRAVIPFDRLVME
jgi:hypothetical protein